MRPGLLTLGMVAACSTPPLLEHGLKPLQDVSSPLGDLSAARCESCHQQTHAAWSESRHAQAWTNAIFQASVRTSPYAGWCRDCHAPLPEQRANAGLRSEGITCVVCHARGGELLSATPPSDEARSRHPIRHEPALASSAFCGGCHQFGLRPDHPMASPEPVQATLDEWVASTSDQTCQQCHLDGHRFRGAHDTEFVRSGLSHHTTLDAEALTVTLTSSVPHRVPTGDPFRRLVWRVCSDPACTEITAERTLGRLYDGPSWHLAADTSLQALDAVRLRAQRPPAGAVWTLDLYYGDPMLEPSLEPHDVSVRLFTELIPPPATDTPGAPAR